ncbi:MAG TPA: ACP phosphodiesterase [Flavitalea sp.]|nr:ACP phosphodiesterase [Flavitalea sp.]
MNYLAHAYLSFGDPEVLTGNMISDFVKGKKKYNYEKRVLAGIELHRAIDEFTDDHPVNKAVSKIFKPDYRLYSAAILDVVYDHFLALDLAGSLENFEDYTYDIYTHLGRFQPLFPDPFNNLFPYMKQHNWLFNYQFTWGIEKSLAGLVHRAAYLTDSRTAFELFNNRYNDIKEAYQAFFPLLKKFALEKFSDIH